MITFSSIFSSQNQTHLCLWPTTETAWALGPNRLLLLLLLSRCKRKSSPQLCGESLLLFFGRSQQQKTQSTPPQICIERNFNDFMIRFFRNIYNLWSRFSSGKRLLSSYLNSTILPGTSGVQKNTWWRFHGMRRFKGIGQFLLENVSFLPHRVSGELQCEIWWYSQ